MRRYVLSLAFVLAAAPAPAQVDLNTLQDEAVEWLQDCIRVNPT